MCLVIGQQGSEILGRSCQLVLSNLVLAEGKDIRPLRLDKGLETCTLLVRLEHGVQSGHVPVDEAEALAICKQRLARSLGSNDALGAARGRLGRGGRARRGLFG